MSLESRYRLLLRTYPSSYRARREEEMLDVLLELHLTRGRRAALGEAWSLVVHGIAVRLAGLNPSQAAHRAAGAAGVTLSCLVLVLAMQAAQGVLTGYIEYASRSEQWQSHVLWVDPRWPVHLAWAIVGAAVLMRLPLIAVAAAWAAVVLHGWHLVAAGWPAMPWPGNVGPHWVAPGGLVEAGWLALTVATACLLGGPNRVRAGLETVSRRALVTAVLAGALGITLSTWTNPVLPAVLSGAVLGFAHLRAGVAPQTAPLLAVALCGPLVVRWPEATLTVTGSLLLFAAGFLVMRLASRRGAPAPAGAQPG